MFTFSVYVARLLCLDKKGSQHEVHTYKKQNRTEYDARNVSGIIEGIRLGRAVKQQAATLGQLILFARRVYVVFIINYRAGLVLHALGNGGNAEQYKHNAAEEYSLFLALGIAYDNKPSRYQQCYD